MLGQKGIGRFACARLANKLELVTKRDGSELEAYASFDWTQFDDEEKYLDEVLIVTEQRQPSGFGSHGITAGLWRPGEQPVAGGLTHGTILTMRNLKRTWEDADFERLRRGLSRLLSPFDEPSDFSIRIELPAEFASYTQDIRPLP